MEWESVGIPMENPQIPLWDGNGNYFKPMGILWEWELKFHFHGNPGFHAIARIDFFLWTILGRRQYILIIKLMQVRRHCSGFNQTTFRKSSGWFGKNRITSKTLLKPALQCRILIRNVEFQYKFHLSKPNKISKYYDLKISRY